MISDQPPFTPDVHSRARAVMILTGIPRGYPKAGCFYRPPGGQIARDTRQDVPFDPLSNDPGAPSLLMTTREGHQSQSLNIASRSSSAAKTFASLISGRPTKAFSARQSRIRLLLSQYSNPIPWRMK